MEDERGEMLDEVLFDFEECSVQVKDIAHLWELGGGTNLTSLLAIPLKAANIEYVGLPKNI